MSIPFTGNNFDVEVLERKIRGNYEEFEIVRRPRVVLAVPVAESGELVLIRQQRAAVDESILEFPAGRVEPGESATRCATRELEEECGFITTHIQKIGRFYSAPHFSDETFEIFLAQGTLGGPPNPTPKESIEEVVKVSFEMLRKMVRAGDIMDSKTLAVFAMLSASDLLPNGGS
jgi:ADP-ribose pyrophosphatase